MFSGQRKKPDSKKSGGQGQQPPTSPTNSPTQHSSSLSIPPTHRSTELFTARGARATDRSPAIGWDTQISGSNNLDSMYKYERSIAQSLNTAVAELHTLLSQQVAITVPDFTHGIATRFVRYIGAIEVPGQMPGSVEVANTYMINLAVRPGLMNLITEWIVTHGRSKGLYPPKFDGITEYGSQKISRAPPEFTQQVCFIDQAPHDPLNAPSQDTSIKMDMLEAIEPLFISGPSGLGKSHLMLGAATQLAGRQNVVVIYIDDAGDLIVQPGSNEQFVSVVEHMACRFIDHQPVLDAITEWYKETEMAQTNLKVKMHDLLKRIRAYCDKKWITAVFFIDDYEKIVDKPSNDVVFDIRELSRYLQFMTVVSSSNPNKMRQIAEATQQCVITTLPDFNDIDNIALAVHPSLDITLDDLQRISKSLDNYPVDVVSTLTRLSNYVERDTRVYADTEFHKVDKVQICINEQILERSTRISRLHSMFVEQCLDNTILRADISDDALKKIRVGKNKEVISTDSGELHSEMLRIKRAVFMMYHGLEMKPGSRRDLHFMVPEYAASASSLGAIESRRYGMVCRPPAARKILYDSYFRGTVLEQFQWIFKLCASKYDMEPNERVRFFDLSLLELGRLVASVVNLETERMTTVTFDFGRQVITLTECISFDSAVEAASKIIADMRNAGPRYLPSKSKQTVTFGYTTMLHLPGLDFDEKWMAEEMRKATHHQGSFILALTREDKFTESVFTGCDIKVTWIVSDPIKVVPLAPGQERDGRTTGVKELPHPADAQAAEREREYNAPLRDMYDNDTEFGYENSWSAKAIKIFERIGDKNRFAGADDVGMIVVAPNDRVGGIIQSKGKLSGVNPESMSSFGFIAIETVNALKPTLKNV